MRFRCNRLKLFLIIFIVFMGLNILNPQNMPSIPNIQQNIQKINNKSGSKQKIPEPNPDAPVVGFVPFSCTFEGGDKNARTAQNELAVSMLKSQAFRPSSVNKWIMETFDKDKSDSVISIVNKAIEVKLAADFICHGKVFKSGNVYGLMIEMYPLSPDKKPTFYFRTFHNINFIGYYINQIVDEMKVRTKNSDKLLFDKSVLIKNFDIKFSLASSSKTGESSVSELPFIKIGRVEYKKQDDFFSGLLLYNMHVSRLFKLYGNSLKNFVNDALAFPSEPNYVISGSLDISKDFTILTVNVTDNINKAKKRRKEDKGSAAAVIVEEYLYTKKHFIKKLDMESVYKALRETARDVSIALLDDKEQQMVSEVKVNSYYADDAYYCKDYFLGKGNQGTILLPAGLTDVEIKFTGKWSKKLPLNIPVKSKIQVKPPVFKTSIGFSLISGFMLHPKYNDLAAVDFDKANGLSFNLDDIYQTTEVTDDLNPSPSAQNGIGFDINLESRYFAIFTTFSHRFGEFYRKFQIDADENINVSGSNIANLESLYEIQKFYYNFDLSFLPNALLLPDDWPVRIYTGLGFFISFLYSIQSERISGSGVIAGKKYEFDQSCERKQYGSFVAGVFPEIGVMYKFMKFYTKFGVSYYLDIFKQSIFTEIKGSNYNTFNTSALLFKIGFGYYLN